MISKKFATTLALFLISFVAVNAVPLNPEYYWGFVYVEDELVPAGTNLSIETAAGEELVKQTLPFNSNFNGSFSIQINFDDIATSEDEGADENERLVWKINGIVVIEPKNDTAVSLKTNNNFTVKGVLNPVVKLDYLNVKSIMLGEPANLNLKISNIGDGSGKVVIKELKSINAELPMEFNLEKHSSKEIQIKINPNACGDYSDNLEIEYYNLADQLVGTIKQDFSFDVTGPDLYLEVISFTNTEANEGEEAEIYSRIINKGKRTVNNFTITFYDGEPAEGKVIMEKEFILDLPAEDTETITVFWDTTNKAGKHIVYGVIKDLDNECNTLNNERKSQTLTVLPSVKKEEPKETTQLPTGAIVSEEPSRFMDKVPENIGVIVNLIILGIIGFVSLAMLINSKVRASQKEEKEEKKEEEDEKEEKEPKKEEHKKKETIAEKKKLFVRLIKLTKESNMEEILNHLREKSSIVVLDLKEFEDEPEELKIRLKRIKKTADIVNADLVLFKNELLVVMPHYGEIYRS